LTYVPAALIPGKEPQCSQWIGGWMGSRASLDVVVRR